ncbi:helix-turn-helix transcriptional regulator [Streptomyces sp. FL07-04A]|uniref:helix-turn-helix domain-containing protein n=1 Tax=Streptomyces sp. FL07-04A TaxID=3028658 RepID=UPI0029BA6F04|nr:helix-turn-helix transcriptional regulator [Streptomyces sp. FL07-04A]MDX3578670.1 helix-turn-helix transcriptional regulator [Streptomyces sp. FL07-04A]
MGNAETSKSKRRANELGPTGEQVAANLQRVRLARGYTMQQLRAEMEKLGRPLPATAVIKTEQGDRRVDVDDLVAFALALNVSPLALLFPPEWSDRPIHLTPELAIRARTAWQWGEGRAPANDWGMGPMTITADGDAMVDGEQQFFEQSEAYSALTHPPERRRSAQHPANAAAEAVSTMVARLVRAVDGGDKGAIERQLRITKNRLAQLQNEVEQIELQLDDR